MTIEEEILEEITNKWNEYNKNRDDKITMEITEEYVNMLLFFDSLFPDVESDEISQRNIAKTIILSHLKNEVIEEIRDSEYEKLVANRYKTCKSFLKS